MTSERNRTDGAGREAASGPATGRRRLLSALAGGAALGLSGCLGGGDADDAGADGNDTTTDGAGTTVGTAGSSGDSKVADTLNFYSWGGSTQEALDRHLVKPFEEEYGVTVKQSSFSSQEKMLANVRSSPAGSYDVVMPSLSGTYTAVQQDLVEPLRLDNVGTWDNLLPVFKDFSVATSGDKTFAAPVYYGTVGMVYNSDAVSGSEPFSWDLTWDQQYGNELTLEGFAFVRVFTTALRLGLDPNTMRGDGADTYDEGIEKVYDAMAEQNDLVRKYWTSGQEQTTLYSNGTAVLGDGWGGRIVSLREDGQRNLHYTIPEEGAYGWSDVFAVAKGSERRYTAEKLIEYAYRPEVMKELSPAVNYPPATKATNDTIEALPDYDSSGGERLKFQDQQFKAKHEQEWSDTFQKIKMGQY